MSIRLRFILLFFLIVGLGFYFLTDWIVSDLRVRYKESVEEVLVDTSQVLSALIASEIQQEQLRSHQFSTAFKGAKKYFLKNKVDPMLAHGTAQRVYITDNQGSIIYDSLSAANEGEDYSKWRDVSLSLKEKYGARFSVEEINGQKMEMKYVAIPIKQGEELLGTLAVGGATSESILVEQARYLRELLKEEIQAERIKLDNFKEAFRVVKQQSLKAHIFHLTKTHVDLRVYVTDDQGIVLFDSDAGRDEGKDYSRWRDVHLALKGEYGARSSLENPQDPRSSIMYVASPIRSEDKIAGVVTVGKPTSRIEYFLRSASPKIWIAGGIACLAVVFLGILSSTWITRPIKKLTRYANEVRDGKKSTLPKLGRSEIGAMGQTLEEMREALEGKKYVESYIQALTHELKSPLSAIRGAAELLDEDMPNEDRRRFLQNINTEVHRMREIVDRLLELASLEGRTQLQNVESIELHALVEDLQKKFHAPLTRKKLSLINQVEPNLRIQGEKFLLQQALSNLLQNAINFSAEHGKISLSAKQAENHVEIILEDEGTGIPEYALTKIFDRFYSLEQPDTKKKSSGLGLSFVKEIALLHQGDIILENRTPHGVRAVLKLKTE